MPADTQEFTTRDVEYLHHGDRRLMARLFVPHGRGPFPQSWNCMAAPGATAT